jgi:N-acetylglutamate synthase-like GNAT family acetyltransferase
VDLVTIPARLVRLAEDADRAAIEALLDDWGMRPVARLGEVYDPAGDPAVVAAGPDGELEGVLTYRPGEDGWEVGTFYVTTQHAGIGTAMLAVFVATARAAGARRLWVVTTNDNLDALRFYQRRGFGIVAVHPGAVDAARRTLKPSIAAIGDHGIPLRDELVLERRLDEEEPI